MHPGRAEAADRPLVVVVHEPGTERMRNRLVEELQLVGFSVETIEGRRKTVAAARSRSDVAAVVHLQAAGRVSSWVAPPPDESLPNESPPDETFGAKDEPADEPVELESRKGEPVDLLALRTAEHLRGELLPAGADLKDDDDRARSATRSGSYRVSLTLGLALTYSSLTGPGIGPVGDVAFWLGRVGVGAFALLPLNRTRLDDAPEHLSHKPTIGGVRLRALLLENDGTGLELQAVASAGARVLSIRGESGANDSYQDTATALAFGLGLELAYAPVTWFAAGGGVGGLLGLPLSGPEVAAELNPPAARAITNLQNASGPDGTFVATGHVTFRF